MQSALVNTNRQQNPASRPCSGSTHSFFRQQTESAKPDAKIQKINSDAHLVERAIKGERRAFDQLVIKYQSRISRLVSVYVSDREAVKDVVQESFIRAYKALKYFRFESQFYTWIYRIAVNTSYNYLKSNKSWMTKAEELDEEHLDEHVISAPADPYRTLEQAHDYQVVEKAIERLPLEMKSVLWLREKEGMSYEQIAEIADCELGTVKSRISRARTRVVQETAHLIQG